MSESKTPQEELFLPFRAKYDKGTERWLARCGGNERPNDDERYLMIKARALSMNSFTADDMLFVINYLTRNNGRGPE